MPRRKLCSGIRRPQVFGQPPHGLQASGPTVSVGTLGEASPGNGQFVGQRAAPAMPTSISSKVEQKVSFTAESETQGTALSKIASDTLDHTGTLHSLVRGQARAAWRSSSKWT